MVNKSKLTSLYQNIRVPQEVNEEPHCSMEHRGKNIRFSIPGWGCDLDPAANLVNTELGENDGLPHSWFLVTAREQ